VLAVLIFAGARLGMTHGLGRAFAAHKNVDSVSSPVASENNATSVPSPAAPSESVASAKYEPATPAEHSASPAPQPQATAGLTDIDPHKTFGSKSAPVSMEVFSDFQCPACKTLFTTTNHQLMDNYVSVGKVFLIHRDFPLPMHAYSRIAARYARAAAQLGKTEVVEQTLFQNQEKWEQTGDVDGTVAAVLSAPEMAKVRALVKGTTLDAAIEKDVALGQGYHVNQTPTTIIHAKGQTYPVVGVVSYDVLKTFLDQLLGQK
jgi:protein-disulfide isomerase